MDGNLSQSATPSHPPVADNQKCHSYQQTQFSNTLNKPAHSLPGLITKLTMVLSVKLSLSFLVLAPLLALASSKSKDRSYINKNAIDRCWRNDPHWASARKDLAWCSIGYAGKMKKLAGSGVKYYEVTDSSDDPEKPKEGTLRYGATTIPGKVWITFKSDMTIKLKIPIFISNLTAIDGRGATVHIAGGSGLVVDKGSNVIIHGLHIHDIQSTSSGKVMMPAGRVVSISRQDLDAISIKTSTKVWVDHNTLYRGKDGLVDVTHGSRRVTVSNNLFKEHDKVMLLGHDDSFVQDKEMRVTVAYNHFGPDCRQRMPRIRHGRVHVANNYHDGWYEYAIGGGANPTIMSEGNLYIATDRPDHKKVAWRESGHNWHVKSVGDVFANGAVFSLQATDENTKPPYGQKQRFDVGSGNDVPEITKDAGALSCSTSKLC
ncbi:pectate lyase 1-like [Asparagus officinalis]|uniref:pectate lyase 1-like n=1 Tax=Asparagus officinalis TaxID=4686 RepID=UPI00098E6419|nr:pectate lyase 1-like [Asparagus officinalis]